MSFEVIGINDLMERLVRTGKEAVRLAGNASLAAAKVIAQGIRAVTPVRLGVKKVRGREIPPGALRKSIGARRLRGRAGLAGAKVGINVGARQYSAVVQDGNKAPHGHLIALGTGLRYTGERQVNYHYKGEKRGSRLVKTGKPRLFRGRGPAVSFVRRGTDASREAALKKMRENLIKGIKREFKKQGISS